jgi:hypothetical protein
LQKVQPPPPVNMSNQTFETFDDWKRAVDATTAEAWAANEALMQFDPVRPEIGVGQVEDNREEDTHLINRLRAVIIEAEELGNIEDANELLIEISELRVRIAQDLLDFFWACGSQPIQVMKRIFAITRRMSPAHLAFMTFQQVATLLNETKQATQTREEKVWESWLEEQGFLGTRTYRGKSDQARKRYSIERKGTCSRKGGKRAVRRFTALRERAKPKQ